tara:strand:- start:161 stop:343 length:183 start_codon:yes stop_codon:yes gene_type:complete
MTEHEIKRLESINAHLKNYMADVNQIEGAKAIWYGLFDAHMEIDKRLEESGIGSNRNPKT